MFVVGGDELGRNAIPLIGHDLLNAAQRERAVLANAFLPVVKESIVEGREALRSHCRHELVVDYMTTPFAEGLTHSLDIVDAGAVEDESERRIVERCCLLAECTEDVIDQHLCVDSFDACICSLLWCVDDRSEDSAAIDAGDHVKPFGVAGRVRGEHILLLAWKNDRACWRLTQPHCNFVEEEYTLLADSLQLASHLADVITQ